MLKGQKRVRIDAENAACHLIILDTMSNTLFGSYQKSKTMNVRRQLISTMPFKVQNKTNTMYNTKQTCKLNICEYFWTKVDFMFSDRKYSVIHCTGYLKSWAPAKIGLDEQEGEGEGEACNLSCLVAVGRVLPTQVPPEPLRTLQHQPNLRPVQFISRHALDGKFLFIDQR